MYDYTDWLSYFMHWVLILIFTVSVPNLGYVGPEYTEYYMLHLCQLVVKLFTKVLGYLGLVGLWHDFCILSQVVWLKESKE